jgi:hypothetical protein
MLSQLVPPLCTLALAEKLVAVAAVTVTCCVAGTDPFAAALKLSDEVLSVSDPPPDVPPDTSAAIGTVIGLFAAPIAVIVIEAVFTPLGRPAGVIVTSADAGVVADVTPATVTHAAEELIVNGMTELSLALIDIVIEAGLDPGAKFTLIADGFA